MLSSVINGYRVNLVETESDIEILKSKIHLNIKVGVDTETDGLEYHPEAIAGFCISCGKSYKSEDYEGYYLPVRHENYDNLPISIVYPLVQKIINKCITVFFNRNYDVSQMEMDNMEIPFTGGMNDVQVMAHLIANEPYPALKPLLQKYLKWETIELENTNFKKTDPRVSYVYAAMDALGTVILGNKLWSEYPYIRKIYPLDNKTLEAVRRLGKQEITIDYQEVSRQNDVLLDKIGQIKQKIFSFAGYQFNLDSNKDKIDLLTRYVTLTKKTKGGSFAVNEEALESIDHPIAKMLIDYAKTSKAISSYTAKILGFKGKPVRINYSTVNVPCLTEINKVRVKDKEGIQEVSIKDVKVDDFVETPYGFRRVIGNFKHFDFCYKLLTVDEDIFIEGNGKHPIKVKLSDGEQYVRLDEISTGDKIIVTVDGVVETRTVFDIISVGDKEVYDLCVEEVHEYIANKVHNHNTGRLSSGGAKNNSYYAPINIQCVHPDTKIKIIEGEIPIKDAKAGMMVWDSENFREILEVFQNGIKEMKRVTLSSGISLVCTDYHAIQVWDKEWVYKQLYDIRVGDLVKLSGFCNSLFHQDINKCSLPKRSFRGVLTQCDEIVSIKSEGIFEAWDLHVADTNRYVADCVLVHNSIPKEEVKRGVKLDKDFGYVLTKNENDSIIGKHKTKSGLRDVFRAKDNFVWLTADYCLSGESKFQTIFGNISVSFAYKLVSWYIPVPVKTPQGFRMLKNPIKSKSSLVKIKTSEGDFIVGDRHPVIVIRDGISQCVKARAVKNTDLILKLK